MFVPWTLEAKSHYIHYSFLSIKHLQAIFNQQRLVGPMNGLLCISGLIWLAGRSRSIFKNPPLIYLALLSSAFLTLTLIWNPDLGPKRDWDLFAPSGFYLYLFAAYLLVKIKDMAPSFPLLWVGWTCVWVNLCSYGSFFLHNRGI